MSDIIKNTKGIVVSKSSNVNAVVPREAFSKRPDNQSQISIETLKTLLAENKISESLNLLKNLFSEQENVNGLNAVVLLSSRLHVINERSTLGLSNHEQSQREKNKLVADILSLIDVEL